MPAFHAYVPAKTFTSDEKRNLADALNLALHEALGTPMDDRFIVISEHSDDELFIHPTFPYLHRSERRIIVTVIFGDSGRSSRSASSPNSLPAMPSRGLASARMMSPC